MNTLLAIVVIFFASFAQAKHLINCEGFRTFPGSQVPATLMLYPRSTLNLSPSTSNAHYLLQILEKNVVVDRFMVLVTYKPKDNRVNFNRFEIVSNPWGTAVGHIQADDFSESLLDTKKSPNQYSTYRFRNCTRTF